MQKNENPIILSIVLLVISVVVAGLLSFTNSITKDKIAQNTQEQQNAAKQEVFATADEFVDLNYKEEGNVKSIFWAMKDDKIQGWCVNVVSYGYGGEIDIMVGITLDYKVSGVTVVSNSETAGLGAKCTEDKFRSQFNEKSAPIEVIKNGTPKENEIVAITGATVTSKAVTSGVNEAIDAVRAIGGGANE